MAEFIVHSIPGSPYGRAVMAMLEEKGASYRLNPVGSGTVRDPEHLARHPFGKVPVLDHGDFRIYETQAILRYLDRALPGGRLTPTDAKDAARMDQLLNINDWYLFQGVANVIVFYRIVGPKLLGLAPDESRIAEAMPRAHTVLGELARLLGDGRFLVGDDLTLADLAIATQIDFFRETPEWGALMDPHPGLSAWLDRMCIRPSLERTTWARVAEMADAA